VQNVVTFKEVVDIPDDATKSKIHATFRIAYIRDAVLPRALDDASFAALHTTMIFNYMDILTSLQQSPSFFQTLFQRLRTVDIHSEQAAQLMSFLQVRPLCAYARWVHALAVRAVVLASPAARLACPLVDGNGSQAAMRWQRVMHGGNARAGTEAWMRCRRSAT
jgi:hypothetical protein